MTKFAIAVLAAAMLAQATQSMAGDKPAGCAAQPASFVPHPHAKQHVYGSPIGPAVVGHAKRSHHKHAPQKQL
jgi:hypothetical protein